MSGFGLIEMMISITIGLVLVAGLMGVLLSNISNSKTNEHEVELQTNSRYAIDHLKRELRQAGFRGYTKSPPVTPTGTIDIGSTECGGAGNGFVGNLHQGIWGAIANPFKADCMAASAIKFSGVEVGDVLVIRRVADIAKVDCFVNPASSPAGINTINSNTFYFRSTHAGGMLYRGSTPPSTVNINAPCGDFQLEEFVYYIGDDDTNPKIPALRRLRLNEAGTMQDEMVVNGIEKMHVQYGRNTNNGSSTSTQYFNADSITGSSTASDTPAWDEVNSVRLWLLARSAKEEPGYKNTDTYSMGEATAYDPPDDGYRRQLFSAVIQLRNKSQ